MSDKQKFGRMAALCVADELESLMEQNCERLEIAGSIRRQKPLVSDIEILYIPKMGVRKKGLFESEEYAQTEDFLQTLLDCGILKKRPNVNGSFAWGEKNKLAIHQPSGIPVDFFATTEENWWVSLVIRTGSKEMNLALTTGAQKRGGRLLAYGSGFQDLDGVVHPAHSEREVFDMCGVEYKEPEGR